MRDIVYITLIIILVTIVLVQIFFRYSFKRKIYEISSVLDDVLKGNIKRHIFINNKGDLSDLSLNINELINSFQKERQLLKREQITKKQLMTNLSHDIRTPLVSVIGYLEAITQKRIPKEIEEEYLHTALNKSLTLKERINQLFEFACIDAKDVDLHFVDLDICELMRNSIIDFIPQLEKENYTVEIEVPDEEYIVSADKIALTRVFQNLIKNAITHGRKRLYIGIFIYKISDEIYIDIKDKGIGIKSEDLPYIFERLYKGDYSRGESGGLGLAISKELIEEMKGSIKVIYSTSCGTGFRVTMKASVL